MTRLITHAVLLAAALAANLALDQAHAAGIDCARASTAVDRAICATPALQQMDGQIAADFSTARDATTGTLRAQLVAGQQRWLHRRAQLCPAADPSCLDRLYGARAATLAALTGRIENGDPELHSLEAWSLTGTWQVASYRIPTSPNRHVQDSDLLPVLPRTGATITAAPGRLCHPANECLDFGLTRTTLAVLASDNGDYDALRLPSTTPAYTVTEGHRSDYNLIAAPDGTLLASFPLCDAGARNCVTAYQVWKPTSSDAAIKDLAAPTR